MICDLGNLQMQLSKILQQQFGRLPHQEPSERRAKVPVISRPGATRQPSSGSTSTRICGSTRAPFEVKRLNSKNAFRMPFAELTARSPLEINQ